MFTIKTTTLVGFLRSIFLPRSRPRECDLPLNTNLPLYDRPLRPIAPRVIEVPLPITAQERLDVVVARNEDTITKVEPESLSEGDEYRNYQAMQSSYPEPVDPDNEVIDLGTIDLASWRKPLVEV